MMPALDSIDHIHVFVRDRASAERWYAQVLGFTRVASLESWAADAGGPLTIERGPIHLALFERREPGNANRTTIALSTGAQDFARWRMHLGQALGRSIEPVDHRLSWSLYFDDPDANPYEITCYDHAAVAAKLPC